MSQSNNIVPCHLIAGSLGVGKTTALLNVLRKRQDHEYTGVLVNDFGKVGVDHVILEGDGDNATRNAMKVEMVPGGCLCCTATFAMDHALHRLLELPRLDRLIIEPSGLVDLSQLVKMLRRFEQGHHGSHERTLQLQPIIVMIDPSKITGEQMMQLPYFSRLIEAADILVANKQDLAKPQQIADFKTWVNQLDPPKQQVLFTEYGKLPDVFFSSHDCASKINADGHHHHHDHTHEQQGGGLHWPASIRFSHDQLMQQLQRFAGDSPEYPLLRLKGIFHTDQGWLYVDLTDHQLTQNPTRHTQDSRVDWIRATQTPTESQMQDWFEVCTIR